MPEKLYTEDQFAQAMMNVNPRAALRDMGEATEARTLRYRLKQANRELGRAGARIYELRSQLAEIRALGSKSERSSYRTLLANYRELTADYGKLCETNQELERRALYAEERLAVAYSHLQANGVRVHDVESPLPAQVQGRVDNVNGQLAGLTVDTSSVLNPTTVEEEAQAGV